MTVAAIIEQAQSRWMDQHPLQVYNRAFQGSYCKYYCILLFVYLRLFLHHRSGAPMFSWRFKELFGSARERQARRKKMCNPIMCTWQCTHIRHPPCECMCSSDGLNSKNARTLKGKLLFLYSFFEKPSTRSITSANKISIESQFAMRFSVVGWEPWKGNIAAKNGWRLILLFFVLCAGRSTHPWLGVEKVNGR